ncbi:MAG: hypothetical protein FJX25_09500 [Alphaproteobacteria bacterium]|nr:hypothetical protein [Alphaproteobacteria bacterium]
MTPMAQRHNNAAPLPDGHGQLVPLIDALALWNAQSESSYLSAGEDLQAIHAMLRAVEDAMARTIAVMTSAGLHDIDARLGAAAELAEALERNGDAIGWRLAEVLKGRDHAAGGNEQVARAFSILEYVALVARTHTGVIGGGGGDLTAFLAQVTVLVGTGRKVASDMSARLADLHDTLEDAAQQLRERQQEDARSAPLIEVIASLKRELESRRGAANGHRSAAHQAFAEAARAVAEVVGVLQFHDIARQRLEHVIDHLRLMFALANNVPLPAADAPADAASRQAWIAHIAQLEQAQLVDLAQLYREKMALIGGSLDAIMQRACEGAGLVGAMLQIDRAQLEDGQGMGITRQAQQLEERFLRREQRRETIFASLADCIRAAGQFAAMTDALDDVEFSLRLAGFNAAIHAADRNSGDRTIGYIAHEIRDSATVAKEGADLIRVAIKATAAAADELQEILLPTEVSSAADISAAIADVLVAVGAAEAECLAQLAGAEVAAADVPDKVSRAKAMMQDHVQGLTLMNAAIDSLASLAAEPVAEVDLSSLSALLSANYTMREERLILAAVFGQALQEEEQSPAAAEDDDLSDIFF